MSSALAKFSQIPVRAKFLIVLRTMNPGEFNPSSSAAFSLNEGEQWGIGSVGTVMLSDDLDMVAVPETITLGNLYRDLGRQVMTVNASGAHLALFREAIQQNSAINEGINISTPPIWICVWRADGTEVGVARTG